MWFVFRMYGVKGLQAYIRKVTAFFVYLSNVLTVEGNSKVNSGVFVSKHYHALPKNRDKP